ncbi:hypothetical protein RZN22_08160 [Bacillaceae bacterium S4-13-58]
MAKVSSFIYCEQADIKKGEKPEIGEILDVLRPDYIPGNYSFSIVFSLMDVQENQDLKVEFIGPNKNVVLETDAFEINGNAGDEHPSEYSGVFAAFDFRNLTFKFPGIYYTNIYINGLQIASFPIPVLKKEDDE